MTVSGDEKDLSHWVLGLCGDMVPVGSIGANATDFNLDPTTDVYGFKWDDGQDAGTTSTYTLTFNGACQDGPTNFSVKGGTYFAVSDITGPSCDATPPSTDTFSVSGTLFVDVNGNGVYDLDDPLLSNTTVTLYDSDGNEIASMTTGSDGSYSFSGLSEGDYTLSVATSTDDNSDFNESLAEYFNALQGPLEVNLSSSDATDVNFGFEMDVADIMNDMNLDDPDADGYHFNGTGRTIGYWKHQNTVAIKGRGRAHVDAATLEGYLATIETLWLADPFQFGGNPYQDALDIMGAKTSDANELLLTTIRHRTKLCGWQRLK